MPKVPILVALHAIWPVSAWALARCLPRDGMLVLQRFGLPLTFILSVAMIVFLITGAFSRTGFQGLSHPVGLCEKYSIGWTVVAGLYIYLGAFLRYFGMERLGGIVFRGATIMGFIATEYFVMVVLLLFLQWMFPGKCQLTNKPVQNVSCFRRNWNVRPFGLA